MIAIEHRPVRRSSSRTPRGLAESGVAPVRAGLPPPRSVGGARVSMRRERRIAPTPAESSPSGRCRRGCPRIRRRGRLPYGLFSAVCVSPPRAFALSIPYASFPPQRRPSLSPPPCASPRPSPPPRPASFTVAGALRGAQAPSRGRQRPKNSIVEISRPPSSLRQWSPNSRPSDYILSGLRGLTHFSRLYAASTSRLSTRRRRASKRSPSAKRRERGNLSRSGIIHS